MNKRQYKKYFLSGVIRKSKTKCAICKTIISHKKGYRCSDKVAHLCPNCYTEENIQSFYEKHPDKFISHHHCHICGKEFCSLELAQQCERSEHIWEQGTKEILFERIDIAASSDYTTKRYIRYSDGSIKEVVDK